MNGVCDSILDASSPQPDDKHDGGRSVLICSHQVWVKVTYDWSTAFVVMFVLLSTPFSLVKATT